MKIRGSINLEESPLFLNQVREPHTNYGGPALFATLEKIPGVRVTTKTSGNELRYEFSVDDIENREFEKTFRNWIVFHDGSLQMPRPQSRIMADGWVIHRRYTQLEYRAVVDAVRLFDQVLTEFKDKFEADSYPNPILVFAEAGIDSTHSVSNPRRGGRFKSEEVHTGEYLSYTNRNRSHPRNSIRVFIGWPGVSLKRVYDVLLPPVARLLPLLSFLHELMHHVQTIEGIPCNIESHTNEELLALARKELADSYIPELYAYSLELTKLTDKWVKTVSASNAWFRLADDVYKTQRAIEALLPREAPTNGRRSSIDIFSKTRKITSSSSTNANQ